MCWRRSVNINSIQAKETTSQEKAPDDACIVRSEIKSCRRPALIQRATRNGSDRSPVSNIRGNLVVLKGLHRAPAQGGYAGDVVRNGRVSDPHCRGGAAGSYANVDIENDHGVIHRHGDGRAVGRGYEPAVGTAGRLAVPHVDVEGARAAGAVCKDTVGIVFELGAVDVDVDARPAGRPDQDTGKGVVPSIIIADHCMSRHMELAAYDGGREVDPVLSEMIDRAVLDMNAPASRDLDAVQTRAQPFQVESAEHDKIARIRDADYDTVGARNQHAGLEPFGGDGDCLGDGHGAETAWIEDVNLTSGRCLGNSSRKSFARSGSAARVRVVTDAGDPGPGGLRVCQRGEAGYETGKRKETNNFGVDHRS